MNPTQKSLIAVLLNQSFDACGDRDDAAYHLIDYPDDKTIQALVTVGSNEEEDEGLVGVCGEALGAILKENPAVDRSIINRLQPMAKLEAVAIVNNGCASDKIFAPTLLQLDRVTVRFGGITAVSELDLRVGDRELVGLIGPNGAGKTTAFNLITGVYQPTDGAITFAGQPTAKLKPHHLARRGIARTFQNIRLFASMSVFDNVRTAVQIHRSHGIRDALWRGRDFRDGEAMVEKKVIELLNIFSLGKKSRRTLAKDLSYGDQRRLEIVRALATQPKLLLLDEPAAGMNPTEKAELTKLIRFIKEKFQIAVLLVEHDMKVVMDICERIAVLDYGVKIAEGSPAEVRANPKVIEAYLGD